MKRTPLRADMTSGDKCFGIVFSLSVTEMIPSQYIFYKINLINNFFFFTLNSVLNRFRMFDYHIFTVCTHTYTHTRARARTHTHVYEYCSMNVYNKRIE